MNALKKNIFFFSFILQQYIHTSNPIYILVDTQQEKKN